MRKIHALKLVPGWNEPKPRRALRKVSCTRASASAGLRGGQAETFDRAGRQGRASSSNTEDGGAVSRAARFHDNSVIGSGRFHFSAGMINSSAKNYYRI